MTDPDLPDELVRYLAERDRQRAERVHRVYETLTKREQRLVREAAVMGFVQGTRHAGGFDVPIPPDRRIVAQVIDACFAFPDLYPAFDAVDRRAARRAAAAQAGEG